MEEIQQLRRLARRGEERARLSTLIDALSAQAETAPGLQVEAAEAAAEVRLSRTYGWSKYGCASCMCV